MNGGDGGGAGDVSAVGPPPPPLEWKFSQVFGERAAGEEVQEGEIHTRFSIFLAPVSFFNLGFQFFDLMLLA